MNIPFLLFLLFISLIGIELFVRCAIYFRKYLGRWIQFNKYSGKPPLNFRIEVIAEASGKEPEEVEKLLRIESTIKLAYSPIIGQIIRPNQQNDVVYINKHGFRGRELPFKKRQGIKRILLLGGSVVYGTNSLSDNATIAFQLEEFLNEYNNPNMKYRWEVINFGVSSYMTYQELIRLIREGLKYEPDYVISLTGFNDASNPYLKTKLVNNPDSMMGINAALKAFYGTPITRFVTLLSTFFVSVRYIQKMIQFEDNTGEEELSPYIYTIW